MEITKEQQKTYGMKKEALKKALALQLGLSGCLFVESVGVLFISFGSNWGYIFLLFHIFFNVGMVAFISLILGIYHPLREVQRLFRAPSDKNIKMQNVIKKEVV